MGDWITSTIIAMGYLGVLLLTLLETVFWPLPSELILPLAGYLAWRHEMTLAGVIVAGTAGSVLGALLLYAVGRRVGEERLKAFADHHGRWLTFSREDIDRASIWFHRHGGMAVLLCRMIPGIRALISIPAGIHRMGLWRFLAYTTVGSAAWTTLLVCTGYVLGSRFAQVGAWIDPVSKAVFALIVATYLWRVFRHKGTTRPHP
jgi:membrane protein DedA with SNARE-associated domain